MQIGVLAFLTEQSGEPGAIAQEAERLGFESFWVAEHSGHTDALYDLLSPLAGWKNTLNSTRI